jgi:hypothetical protein
MKAFLDRFEDGKAVIVFEEEKESALLPRRLLPFDCKEGDILTISVKINKSETQKRREEIQRLQGKSQES